LKKKFDIKFGVAVPDDNEDEDDEENKKS